jgi:hypothetical protein
MDENLSTNPEGEFGIAKRVGPDGKPLPSPGGGIQVDDKYKGQKGTIIVEFYKTKEF